MRSDFHTKGLPNNIPLVIPVFNHADFVGPIDGTEEGASFFHGRDSLLKSLVDTLKIQENGCVLVAGYKGVGKTSLINKAIKEVQNNSDNKNILDLRISLGSSLSLSQEIVFAYIVDELELKFLNVITEIVNDNFQHRWGSFDYEKNSSDLNDFLSDTIINSLSWEHESLFYILSVFGSYKKTTLVKDTNSYLLYLLNIGLREKKKIKRQLQDIVSIFRQLRWLKIELDQGFIEQGTERDRSGEVNVEINPSLFSGLKLLPKASIRSKKYSKNQRSTGNIQRIEKGITRLINKINGFEILGTKLATIIVFDELDKVRSGGKGINQEILERKVEIDSLLDNSKNFLTTCNTVFIFVGDRDLFETTKRYRKDRGTHSGIFRKTFLVESFVTDHSDGDESHLASMIEAFLVKRLLTQDDLKEEKKPDYPTVRAVYKKYSKCCDVDHTSKDFQKTFYSTKERYLRMDMLLIRHIIHYITINSKGVASGVNDIYRSFIRRKDDWYAGKYEFSELLPDYLEEDQIEKLEYVLVISERRLPELKWSSDNFIILHRRLSWLLSKYDDKIVVSIFSIFHHIQKLYFIGFERKDIEKTAELLNIHKEEGLDRLVRTMLGTIFSPSIYQHSGLLNQFRFVSLYQQEIRYVLSVNDKDSFGYQFTQEELLPIMQHYLGKDFSGTDGLSLEIIEIDTISDLVTLGYLSSLVRKYEDAIKCFRKAELVIEKRRKSNNISLELLHEHIKIKLRIANSMERAMRNKADILNEYTQNLVILRRYKNKYNQVSTPVIKIPEAPDSKEIDLSKNISYLQQKVYFARLFMMLKNNPLKLLRKSNHRIDEIVKNWNNGEDYLYRSPNLIIKNQPRHERTLEALMEYSRLMFFSNHNRRSIELLLITIELSEVLVYSRKVFVMSGGLALQRLGISLNIFNLSQLHKYLVNRHSNYNMVTSTAEQKINACEKFIEIIYKQILTMKGVTSVDSLIQRVFHDGSCEDLQDTWKEKKREISQLIIDKHVDASETDINKKIGDYSNCKNFNLSESLAYIAIAAKKMEAVQQYRNAAEAYMTIIFIWNMYLENIPWSMIDENKEYIPRDSKLSNDISMLMLNIGKKASRCISLANNKSYSNFIHSFWFGILKDNDNFPSDFDISRLVDPIETLFGHYSIPDEKMKDDICVYIKEPIFWEHSLTGKHLKKLLLWENHARSSIMRNPHKLPAMDIHHRIPYSIKSYITTLWITARKQLTKARSIAIRNPEDIDKVIKVSALAIENLYNAINTTERISGDYQDIVFPQPFLLKFNLWEVIYNILDKHIDEKNTGESKKQLSHSITKKLLDYQSDENTPSFDSDIPSTYMNYLRVKSDAIKELSISQTFGDISGSSTESLLDTKRYQESDFDDNYLYLDWSGYQMFGGAAVVHKLTITIKDDRLENKINEGMAKKTNRSSEEDKILVPDL